MTTILTTIKVKMKNNAKIEMAFYRQIYIFIAKTHPLRFFGAGLEKNIIEFKQIRILIYLLYRYTSICRSTPLGVDGKL